MRRWRRHRNTNASGAPAGVLPASGEVLSEVSDEQFIAWPDREAAFSALYSRYASNVLVYCRLRVSDPHDAEDLAASIFTNAWSAFPPDNRGSFRSWLFTIAHHAVGNYYRHQGTRGSTRSLIERDADVFHDPGQTPEMTAIRNDDARELRQALAQLGDDQRQAIELRLAGLKGREIADVLGRSEAAVKMLQYRAMEHLRDVLSRHHEPTSTTRPTRKEHADAC